MTVFAPMFWSLVVLLIVINNYADISMKSESTTGSAKKSGFLGGTEIHGRLAENTENSIPIAICR
jgi:hypothetical protein